MPSVAQRRSTVAMTFVSASASLASALVQRARIFSTQTGSLGFYCTQRDAAPPQRSSVLIFLST
jgi:hypothetical protein